MNTELSFAPSSNVSQNDRISAAIAHGGTCVAWFLAPLLIWLLEKDRSKFVERQALQALLWSVFGTVVSLATCGVAIPIFLCFHVYAAIRILRGDDYEYPFIGGVASKLSSS